MFLKKITVAAISTMFVITTMPVQAATFGKSSSSSNSRSSSFSSNNSSRTSSSFNSNSRNSSAASTNRGGLSQGSSVGMSRSALANDVKNNNYRAPANGTTVAGNNSNNTNNYNNSNYNRSNNAGYNNNSTGYNNNGYNNGYNNSNNNRPNQGYGTGAVVGAAAVGALAGYALGNHNSTPAANNTNMNNGAGYNNGTAYNNGNAVNGANVVSPNGVNNSNTNSVMDSNGNYNTALASAPVKDSSGGFGSFIWGLIKIIVGLGVLYFIVKVLMSFFNNRNKNGSVETNFGQGNNAASSAPVYNNKTPEDQIRDMKEDFFVKFQDSNRPSKLDYIRQNSTPMFFNAVEDMVKEQSDSRSVKVRQLEAELVDITQDGSRYIASVRYKAVVSEGEYGNMQDTELKEMWNFVYENNRWVIAGIDQL